MSEANKPITATTNEYSGTDAEQEYAKSIVQCAKIGADIIELESECKMLHANCVSWQQNVWVPLAIGLMVVGGVIGGLIGQADGVTMSGVTCGTMIAFAVDMLWFVLLNLGLVRNEHKRLVEHQKKISSLVKKEWIPAVKKIKQLKRKRKITKHGDLYDKLVSMDSYMRSLTLFRKTATQTKQYLIDSSISPETAMLILAV